MTSATEYFFVVRARDEAGINDTNTVELSDFTTDIVPPTFAGLTSATKLNGAQIQLAWTQATDTFSLQPTIVYDIFVSTTSPIVDFSTASITTAAGVAGHTVTGLNDDTDYFFVVRARDEAGNRDTNTVPQTAKTDIDNTLPTFVAGLTLAAAFNDKQINLSWDPASDDSSLARDMVYDIYMATLTGTQNFSSADFTTTKGATSFSVTGLSPVTTYFFVVRARDLAGNQDTNTVEQSDTTSSAFSDTIPPVFGGANNAQKISSSLIVVSWLFATDNITDPAAIVYEIYQANITGTQVFSTPTYTKTGGTSFNVTGLSAGTQYFFVVRARDEAGNTDANTGEVSATTDP